MEERPSELTNQLICGYVMADAWNVDEALDV